MAPQNKVRVELNCTAFPEIIGLFAFLCGMRKREAGMWRVKDKEVSSRQIEERRLMENDERWFV